jgi:predicted enzyme related to lactoylglutathione lyase
MKLFKNINVVSYNVSDWEQSKKFYGETLGLGAPAFLSDEFGWAEYGGGNETHLALNKSDAPPAGNGGATVVFSVEDAYKAVEELRKRGVKCEDVIPIPGMVTYATFYDPEGNKLQMAGPPPPG